MLREFGHIQLLLLISLLVEFVSADKMIDVVHNPASWASNLPTQQALDEVINTLLSTPFLPDDYYLGKGNSIPYTCLPAEEAGPHEDLKFRGTSLGGWLVLEPWITPSMFYQFLGANRRFGTSEGYVAFDSYTFCKVLGSEEANRQLRIHWKHWVTEDQIRNLAALGINTVRIPIADWMYSPYYPFDSGCWDGALEELDRVLNLCTKYKMKVLLDLHAVKGSQNGLDNSGDTGHYEWINGTIFRHWDIRGGDWVGQYDTLLRRYVTINETQLVHTLTVIQRIAMRYASHPSIVGLQPVNEPWDMIPWPIVREFYWRTYRLLRHLAPNWKVIFHDSFRLGTPSSSLWLAPNAGIDFPNNPLKDSRSTRFLANCMHYMVDIHIYQAWAWDPYDTDYFLRMTCEIGELLRGMEKAGIPVVVGEWSLATDNCAMWLNGLNDNVPGYPKAQCKRISCPAPYFPTNGTFRIPNAPPDISIGKQGPYGSGGESYMEFGTCPVDHTHHECNVTQHDLDARLSANASTEHEALVKFYRRNIVSAFAAAQWSAYNLHTHGSFFWNFRTELEDTWDIQQATAMHLQWLPRNMSISSKESEMMMQWGCIGYNDWFPSNSTPQYPVPNDIDYAAASVELAFVKFLIVSGLLIVSTVVILWLILRPSSSFDLPVSVPTCPPISALFRFSSRNKYQSIPNRDDRYKPVNTVRRIRNYSTDFEDSFGEDERLTNKGLKDRRASNGTVELPTLTNETCCI